MKLTELEDRVQDAETFILYAVNLHTPPPRDTLAVKFTARDAADAVDAVVEDMLEDGHEADYFPVRLLQRTENDVMDITRDLSTAMFDCGVIKLTPVAEDNMRISESAKVTLTVGQLKRLVKESAGDGKVRARRKEMKKAEFLNALKRVESYQETLEDVAHLAQDDPFALNYVQGMNFDGENYYKHLTGNLGECFFVVDICRFAVAVRATTGMYVELEYAPLEKTWSMNVFSDKRRPEEGDKFEGSADEIVKWFFSKYEDNFSAIWGLNYIIDALDEGELDSYFSIAEKEILDNKVWDEEFERRKKA